MAEYKNILIIGAGMAGKLLEKDILENHSECKIVGFVDDEDSGKTKSKVIGKISDLSKISKIYKIDEMIIAIPSASGNLTRRILLENIKNNVPIRTVPRSQKILQSGNVHYSELQALKAGDFLGRPFVKNKIKKLQNYYRGKKVLITGGAGSIGSEIVRQLIELGAKTVVYDSSEYGIYSLEQYLKENGIKDGHRLIIGNILNKNKLDSIIKKEKPKIIFHAAAYKHIHLMEDNVDEAILNNVIGTRNVIDTALENKIGKFTFISTDKVVNPTSIMGASKKICEFYIKSLKSQKTKFNIVRFGNVINSSGSVIPLFERQIEENKCLTVTHKKMMRFFMSISEAAQLVIESSASIFKDSIHILNMGELISIFELAQCLIRSKNMIPEDDVKIIFTGLRKGEKMIEELFTKIEEGNIVKTKSKNIFVLKNFEKCPMDVNKMVKELAEIACHYPNEKVLGKYLKEIFPSLKLK